MAADDDPLRAALQDRLKFESLVADLVSRFVNIDSDRIDATIQDAQQRLVEALDLDRSALFQFSESESELVFTHYWSRPELPPLDPRESTRQFPWAVGKVLKGEIVCFSSLDELPPDAADRTALLRIGTKS